MDKATSAFLAAAKNGDSVYITEVREAYAALSDAASFAVDCQFEKVAGGWKSFRLRLPLFGRYPEAGYAFAVSFFLAEMYNILSGLGGVNMRIIDAGNHMETKELVAAFEREFGLDTPRRQRSGYGRCLNVIERMVAALRPGAKAAAARFTVSIADAPHPAGEPAHAPAATPDLTRMFAHAAGNLSGKALLGMDIGGTDIKLALALDRHIVCFKEYDWFPASFTAIDQMIEPIRILVRLMALAAAAHTLDDTDRRLTAIIAPAMHKDADVAIMSAAIDKAIRECGDPGFLFDALGICFPDVVVGDKIVGGEVYKTRGMRTALGDRYDAEFTRLTILDQLLSPMVKTGGVVGIVNDGPMAAFTAGVELAVNSPVRVKGGVFAHTLGTELGTGWVNASGVIPDIPLEVYNFIIDLGSFPEREFEPDDLRSINNFNTSLPGTLQKFTSQSGVFRLAVKYFTHSRPDLLEQMRHAGFIVERLHNGKPGLYVPTDPKDMRKPFLEHMMALAESDPDPEVKRIFREIGMAMAVAGKECDWILEPATRQRMLFGRLVKRQICFELIREGALMVDPQADLAVADDGIAETILMKELKNSTEYSIAQFAQAVGAIYYANHRLLAQ